MTVADGFLPMTPTKRMLFVVYEGFEILDLSGPSSVFSSANMETGEDIYRVEVFSPTGGPVTCWAGPVVMTEAIASLRPGPEDTLLVVGAEKEALDKAASNKVMADWLVATVSRVRRFGSFCMGSFLLAKAGLLDSKSATTHWAAGPWLEDIDPSVKLDPKALYVKDDRTWTSAGLSSGIDMALAMVEEDLGREIMGRVARRLVVYAHRPGDQAQRSVLLEDQVAAGEAFADTIAWLEANLHQPIKVADMAARAGMSERAFYRRFVEKWSATPAKYLEGLRLERGKRLLEAGMPLKAAAPAVGYRSESAFREAFQTRFGAPPSQVSARRTT